MITFTNEEVVVDPIAKLAWADWYLADDAREDASIEKRLFVKMLSESG